MKVVINRCFGGFGLSELAFEKLLDRKNIKWERQESTSAFLDAAYFKAGHADDDNYYLADYDFYEDRSDVDLVAVVEELGQKANGKYAELAVIEIPDDVEWYVEEYDGREHIAERHRTWS